MRVQFLNHANQLISCGSDGLIKLWNIKTSSCVATFDEHNDKCWSLLLSGNEEKVVTGGADGKLIVWRDITDEILEEKMEEREEIILKFDYRLTHFYNYQTKINKMFKRARTGKLFERKEVEESSPTGYNS